MNCPKCKSDSYCKDGFVQGRQRYKCKKVLLNQYSFAKIA